jgi:hypothetical protein
MFGRVNWQPSRSDVRYFAITLVVAVFIIAITCLLLGRRETAVYPVAIGLLLAVPSYIFPRFGQYVYLLWMAISYLLGRIVSPIVIGIIFYLVLTPMALFFRLLRRDTLELKRPKDRTSYFHDYPDTSGPDHFRRQY